jgi:hypothetical protein
MTENPGGPFDDVAAPSDLFLTRPTEFVDWLSYILLYGPDEYPDEDRVTNSSAFAEAFKALAFFRCHTRTDEGRESLDQVTRNLHVVYEHFEADNRLEACHLLQDTEAMFQKARRYIAISDA